MNNGVEIRNRKTPNLKVILVILGFLIISVGVVISFVEQGGSSKEAVYLSSVFDPDKPIVIKKDGKYGYITSEGKMMIEPKYKSASSFNGNYAVVTIDNPDTTSYYKTVYQIIDKKGNVLNSSESSFEPDYLSEYDVWVINGVLYDSKLNKKLADGIVVDYIGNGYFEYEDNVNDESGIIDYKGKKFFTWAGSYIYTDMSNNDNTEDDLYVRVTIYDERDSIVSLKTGKIVYSVDDVKNNHLFVEDDGVFREYNKHSEVEKFLFFADGKLAYQTSENLYDFEVVDYENQILELDYGYDYDEIGKSQRRYYYDVKNKELLEENPSSSSSSYDEDVDLIELTYGYKKFNSSGKYGLMSLDKVVIPCEYDDIEFLNPSLFNYMKSKRQELALFEKDDTMLLMNLKNKKTVASFNSTYVYDYEDSTFLRISIYENYSVTGYIIYNLLSGNSMSLNKDDDVSVYSNYIVITKDNKKTYYNTKLEQIYVQEL